MKNKLKVITGFLILLSSFAKADTVIVNSEEVEIAKLAVKLCTVPDDKYGTQNCINDVLLTHSLYPTKTFMELVRSGCEKLNDTYYKTACIKKGIEIESNLLQSSENH
ncbi:MAG: hypothetical protein ACXVCY_09620 [Pseudobdellovibrionaceae bacterium]